MAQPLVLLIVTIIVFSIVNPRFMQANSISLLVQQTAVVAALALGQTLVILTAGIDLSCGAICVLSMMIMASLSAKNGLQGFWPWPSGSPPACWPGTSTGSW